MQYFHRTSLSPDHVFEEADRYLGSRLQEVERQDRERKFQGAVGTITVSVRAEGGHYTHVTAATDQVAESEADKLAKRFLAIVHQRAEPSHALRGAY